MEQLPQMPTHHHHIKEKALKFMDTMDVCMYEWMDV